MYSCAIEEGNMEGLTIRDIPLSYAFDSRETIDYFSMGIHLPGFLQWGDVSLAAALTGMDINVIDPVTMSGNNLTAKDLEEYKAEFKKVRDLCGETGKVLFIQ